MVNSVIRKRGRPFSSISIEIHRATSSETSSKKKRGSLPSSDKIDRPSNSSQTSTSSETSSKKKRGRPPFSDKTDRPSNSSQISSKKNNTLRQHQEQRFTDTNGTIYPRIGDKVKILFDQRDWYVGTVHDFDVDAKIISTFFEEEGEIEMRDFPNEDVIVVFTDLNISQRNGGRPLNSLMAESDMVFKDLKKDFSNIVGSQYAAMYYVAELLCEYWCTIIDAKVVKGKEICTCQWSDGSKTKEPLKKVIDSINLNRANIRRGKNGAAVPNAESDLCNLDIGVKSPSSTRKRNSGPSQKSKSKTFEAIEPTSMKESLNINDETEHDIQVQGTHIVEGGRDSAASGTKLAPEDVCVKDIQGSVPMEDLELILDGSLDTSASEITYESIMTVANSSCLYRALLPEASTDEPVETNGGSTSRSIKDIAPSPPSIHNEEVLTSSNARDGEQGIRMERGLEVEGGMTILKYPFASIDISSSGIVSQVDFLQARLRVLQLECDTSLAGGDMRGGDSEGCGDTKDESNLTQRELFLLARIQQLELDTLTRLLSSMPARVDSSGDDAHAHCSLPADVDVERSGNDAHAHSSLPARIDVESSGDDAQAHSSLPARIDVESSGDDAQAHRDREKSKRDIKKQEKLLKVVKSLQISR